VQLGVSQSNFFKFLKFQSIPSNSIEIQTLELP
jgi:hypothetical protein